DLTLARAWLTVQDLDELPKRVEPPRGVHAVEVGGRIPRPENVRAIRAAVAAIPLRLLSLWLGSGGRMEIVAGSNARLHSGTETVLGFWRFGTPSCVVAGDHHDCVRTSLHELGHCLNFLLRFPSRSEQWLRIWGADRRAGRV